MDIDYGTGGTASCVLSPPFNCNGRNYNTDYISKLVEDSSRNKLILANELRISNYLIRKINKATLEKYCAVVVDSCVVNSNQIKRCGKPLIPNTNYRVLYSKNGSCKPVSRKSKLFVKNNSNLKRKISVNNIKNNKIISNGKTYEKNNIVRLCGNLFVYEVIELCFSKKNITLSIRRLLNILKLLRNNNVIHLDIKMENLVVNTKKEIRVIDFGGSIIYRDLNYLKTYSDFFDIINNFCRNNIYTWTSTEFSPEMHIIRELYKNNNIDRYDMFLKIKLILEKSIYVDKNRENELITLINYIYDNKMAFITTFLLNNKESDIYKVDIYAIGITLYFIFEKILKKQYNIKIDISRDNIHKLRRLKLYEFGELIYNMSRIDYRNRYSLKDCWKSNYFK
jgi:serine/threonine protein kinase